MCFSSSPGCTVYVPPLCGLAVGAGIGVGGTGVAVGRGVAVGGANVGGGSGFEDAGRLPMMAVLVSADINPEGAARLVPGSWATARMTSASGTSSARPSTYRWGPPPDAMDTLDPLDARI